MIQQLEPVFAHPPPPPPPPPPPTTVQTNKPANCEVQESPIYKSKYTTMCTAACDAAKVSNFIAIKNFEYHFSKCDRSIKLLSHENQTVSIIQNGPTCGIVALSIASQLLGHVNVDTLLQRAKDKKYTVNGEMFSAYDMAELAHNTIGCDAEVVSNLDAHKYLFLEHILKGLPILIPYDADKNHEPCCKNGNKAHWAIVSGLCLTFDDLGFDTLEPDGSYSFKNEFLRSKADPLKYDNICKMMRQFKDVKQMYFYCRQGKSRQLAVWSLDKLIQSNNNLFEYDKIYSDGDIKILGGDDLSNLRDKLVILMPKGIS